MLKIGKKYLLLVLTLLLVLQLPIQARAKEINDDPFIINGTAKITNLETGEVKEVELTDIKELSTFNFNKDGNNYDKTVEATFKIPQISIDSNNEIGEKDNGDVTAKLTMNYDYSASDEKIRINYISGHWIPLNDFILVDNREVGCHDGRPLGKSFKKYPTSNTFYYSTGWGYVDYYPVNPPISGPRAYSEARVIIPGMGSGYMIEVNVYIYDPD